MGSRNLSHWKRPLLEIVVIASVYVAGARLGQIIAIPPGNVTAVWPPSGVALAAILLRGYHVWPGIGLGALIGNTWVFFDSPSPMSFIVSISVGAAIATGSTLQALLGAYLIQLYVGRDNLLAQTKAVLKFVSIELLSCMVSPTVGVTSLYFGGFILSAAYANTWNTWWIGDTVGVLVVAPLILAWSKNMRISWEPRRVVEAVLTLLLLFTAVHFILNGFFFFDIPPEALTYTIIPFTLWAAFRFGQRGVVTASLLVSGIVIWGMVSGLGPFMAESANDGLLMLQVFIGVVTVTGLLLAASLSERKQAEEETQRNLERVRALHEINLATTSTLEFRTVLDLLLEKIDLFLPYAAVTLRLFYSESGMLEPVACRNLDEKEWKMEQWKGGRGLANAVFESEIPMIVRNAKTDPRVLDREFYLKHQLVSYLGVPLIAKGQTLGVLNFYTKQDHEFSGEEVEFLSMLASQAAIAIHNSRLHEKTKAQAAELEAANKEIELRSRQEATVAEFGRQALAGVEVPELMETAVVLLSQNLGVEYSKVLELLPDGGALLLRAGVGWKEGCVGRETVSAGTESQAGYTLLTSGPVITGDLRAETRFGGPALLLDHGVVSGASVVIQGRERPFGVLGAHTAERRIFSQDDIHFLQAIANTLSTAIERKRTEESLREMQARLQLAIQGSKTGLWDWDTQTNEAYFFPEWKKQLGYEDHEIPNRFDEWEKRLHPEDRARMLTIVKSYLGNPWPDYEAEFRLRHKDGSYRWILARAALLQNDGEKTNRMLGCNIDITEHKKAEGLLAEWKNRYEAAIRASGQIFYDWNSRNNEVLWGGEVGKILGCSLREMPENLTNYMDMIHPDDRSRFTQEMERLAASKQSAHLQYRLRRKDGVYIDVEDIGHFFVDRSGATTHMAGFISDVTERKKAQEKIQGQLRRLGALHEINLATTSTLDLRTVLNLLLEKIDFFFPYSVMTLRLLNPGTKELEPVAYRNLDEQEWRSTVKEGGRGVSRAVFEKKGPVIIADVQTDPRTRHPEFMRRHGLVSYLGLPLAAGGEVLGVLSFFTKERHPFDDDEVEFLSTLASQAAIAIYNSQLYERIKQQAVELKSANRAKDEFLSVVSHELRTPLNTIVGYTEMVKDKMLGEIKPEQDKALGKVLARSKDLLGMITGILEATSIGTGAVKVENSEVRLGEFLDEFRLIHDIAMMNKTLVLKWDYPSNLPVVITDKEKLKHILQNLIHNAIKFTEKGRVAVSVCYKPQSRSVVFKVSDTGVGIAEEHLMSIFEIFQQVDSSETRVYGGAGVGLYIVKKFTDLLGGTVEVKSKPGKGSTFIVTLPAVTAQP